MRTRKLMTQAEIAQAQALFIQGLMPSVIAKSLTEQRIIDKSTLPEIPAWQITGLAHRSGWRKDRQIFAEKESETIATALEQLKGAAGNEMVALIKELHQSFADDVHMLKGLRKKCDTTKEALDFIRAEESLQKRLFHFHSIRPTPLASAAIPMTTIQAGSTALEGGLVDDIEGTGKPA